MECLQMITMRLIDSGTTILVCFEEEYDQI